MPTTEAKQYADREPDIKAVPQFAV